MRAAVAPPRRSRALDALLGDDDVDEVLVNAGGDIWVERDGTTSPRRLDRRRRPRRRHRADPRPARPPPRPHQPGRRRPPRRRLARVRGHPARRARRRLPLGASLPRPRRSRSTAFADAAVADLLDELLGGRCNVLVVRRDVVGQDVAPQHDARPDRPRRADRRHRGHRGAAPGRTTTSCASRRGRRRPTDCRRSRSSSSCARPCACGPTASSSARCAARRCSGSSRPSTPATTAPGRPATPTAPSTPSTVSRRCHPGRARHGRCSPCASSSPARSTPWCTSPAPGRRPAGWSRSARSSRTATDCNCNHSSTAMPSSAARRRVRSR